MITIYYLIEDNIPFYIGKTKNKITIREYQHKKRLNKNIQLIELDIVNSNEWKFWESWYIELFKSWGFKLKNKNKGGGGPSFHTELSKNKMKNTPRPNTSKKLSGKKRPDVSDRLKGKNLSLDIKQKISKNKINHECYKDLNRTNNIVKSNLIHYQKGSNRNKKISQKIKGRKNTWITKIRSIPIIQYDKNNNLVKEWDSASEAAKYLNKPSSAITECCHNKRKSAYGYKWTFKLEKVLADHLENQK
jgi:hypothetical protein